MATIEKSGISGLLGAYSAERELSESLAFSLRLPSDLGSWYSDSFAGEALTRPFPNDEGDEAASAEGYREFAPDAMSWAEGTLAASFEVWPHE